MLVYTGTAGHTPDHSQLQGVLPAGDDDIVVIRGSGARAMLRGSRAEPAGTRLRLPASSSGIVAGAVEMHDALLTAEAAVTAFETAIEATAKP